MQVNKRVGAEQKESKITKNAPKKEQNRKSVVTVRIRRLKQCAPGQSKSCDDTVYVYYGRRGGKIAYHHF